MALKDLFLSGDERLTNLLGIIDNEVTNKYTPINPNLISYAEIDKIFRTNGQLEHLKSLWFANIGRNGQSVNIRKEYSERTKDLLQNKLYNFLYSDIDFKKIKNQIITYLFQEGNCIIRIIKLERETKLIAESIREYSVYYDKETQTTRYKKKKNNTEVGDNLYHGVDLFHIKDPHFTNLPVAPARVNLIYNYLVLENYGVKVNANLFEKGGIGLSLLSLNAQAYAQLDSKEINPSKPDAKGESVLSKWLKDTWSKVTGTRNSNTIRVLPGLEKVFELGKDNKSMQFVDLIGTIAPEKISWAWNITLADLGSGDNTTYNNTNLYSYVLYEKVGRDIEDAIDEAVNNWVLPQYNFPTSIYGDISITFNRPSNPDRVAKQIQAREDWINNLITLNEYRDSQDMPALEGGDVFLKDWAKPEITFNKSQTVEVFAKSDQKKKKFLAKWQKAISRQVSDFIDSIDTNTDNITVKLPKIESYYSFPNLAADLTFFFNQGIAEVEKDDRINLDGYPDIIKEAIQYRTLTLLKGDKDNENSLLDWVKIPGFKGVDDETANQISNYISSQGDKPTQEIIKGLQELVPNLSATRAEVIARTEVNNAVEGTRYILYEQEFGKGATSTWQTAGDSRVGDDHKENDGETRLLGDSFSSGETRPGQRPNCRCTSIINPPKNF